MSPAGYDQQQASATLARGRKLGALPQPGETIDAYAARLDALACERKDAAPGPARERFG